MLLEQNGLLLGGLLLMTVTVWALFLGRKAARSVSRFREDDHRRFTRQEET